MKTLLANINVPGESKDFLRYVAGLANNLGLNVKVLYIQTPPNYSYGLGATAVASVQVEENYREVIDESKRILENNIEEISKEISRPVFIDSSAEIGTAATIINETVTSKEAEMVILEGQQDESFWMQTTSNIDIIEMLECPVWIIPKGAIYRPFSEIVYATDYNEEDIVNLEKLISLFPHLTPNIMALHITDSVDFEERIKKAGFTDMIQSKTSYKKLTVKALYKSKDNKIVQLLNDFARNNSADLLVILKENKSFFEGIFKSDHTKGILKATQLPVLVYHEKK